MPNVLTKALPVRTISSLGFEASPVPTSFLVCTRHRHNLTGLGVNTLPMATFAGFRLDISGVFQLSDEAISDVKQVETVRFAVGFIIEVSVSTQGHASSVRLPRQATSSYPLPLSPPRPTQ